MFAQRCLHFTTENTARAEPRINLELGRATTSTQNLKQGSQDQNEPGESRRAAPERAVEGKNEGVFKKADFVPKSRSAPEPIMKEEAAGGCSRSSTDDLKGHEKQQTTTRMHLKKEKKR